MSHIIGSIQNAPTATIGPDFGPANTPPNTWSIEFSPVAAPTGTKFIMLHFTAVSLPGTSRLEVDLGYDTDVFTAADGGSFYTRPVNVSVLPGGQIPVRYIAAGAASGGARIDSYARGERHIGEQDPTALSNCDPFLLDTTYVEPKYDPFWYCTEPPNWENVANVTLPADVRARVARSVGIIITVELNEAKTAVVVSSCSVTLVDADVVLTAGHCHTPEEALSASITFDYQTDQFGARPAGYNPRFFKVKKVIAHKHEPGVSASDYSLLQISPAPAGIAPIQMRPDVPAGNESVFGIHHPNGAVKKLSVPHPSFAKVIQANANAIQVPANFSVSGGSSGSGLFDLAGRITGILSNGGRCSVNPPLSYFPTASILQQIAPAPPAPLSRDVVIVFDRSGSMGSDDGTGRSKIDAARDALSLFVQLVKSGAGNRLGLVSFSTSASSPADFNLGNLNDAEKAILVGNAPYISGIVANLNPGGATSIGDGLDKARQQFSSSPGPNPKAILLMTDGLENTPPMISDVQGSLSGTDVHVIGFGSEANLDGAKLSALASSHHGLYTRAESGLSLEKFFSHAFGNIFEAGILIDPEYQLASGVFAGPMHPFQVSGEEALTVVIGWDLPGAELHILTRTPGGTEITKSSPAVVSSTGRSWAFLKITLPFGAERDGTWSVQVTRPQGRGEFASQAPALNYFFNIIPSGGAILKRVRNQQLYYSGDPINPLVMLRYANGGWPRGAKVELTVTSPKTSIGNLLSQKTPQAPLNQNGDTLPSRQSTLSKLNADGGKDLITYLDRPFALSEDPRNAGGGFEESGVYGLPLKDLLQMEGNYTFHVKASYGAGQSNTREILWTQYVDVGIDPSKTKVSVTGTVNQADGTRTGTLVITPADVNGNLLGPGRGDAIQITGTTGSTITGTLTDNQNGSYSVGISWVPTVSTEPGVVITQPGRPPVSVKPKPEGTHKPKKHKWQFWLILLLLLLIILLLLVLLLK